MNQVEVQNTNIRQPAELIELLMTARSKKAEFERIADDLVAELAGAIDPREPDAFGSKTYNVGDFKVVVDRPKSVSVPAAEIQKMEAEFRANNIPLSLMPFKMKPEFSESHYKAIKELGEAVQAFKIASKFVVTKPGKVKVEIKV